MELKTLRSVMVLMAAVSAVGGVGIGSMGCAEQAPRTGVVTTRAMPGTWGRDQAGAATVKGPELPRNAAVAKGAMVATVNKLATEAGLNAIRRGGNAVDAAIAAAATLGVVDSFNSGIGGGCFMIIRKADGTIYALDGREMAPAAATRDMFIRNGKGDTTLSQNGPLASGIPGSVAVYQRALELAGRGTLADVLLPAAQLAEDGFVLDERFPKKVKNKEVDLTPIIKRYPGTARVLLHSDGTPRQAGEVLRQPDLAMTYRKIATEGIGYFYGGEFAQKVGTWMRENGGIITAADFANYQVKEREALRTTYRGYEIIGMPPPSSGGVHVAEILNILEHFDVANLTPAQRVHVTADAMKLAFADRAHWLGDPDFVKVPTGLIRKDYADTLAARISMDKTVDVPTFGTPPEADTDVFGAEMGKHTTHIATADADGNVVAMTCTVNTSFGSKVIVPGTGVILNDQMDDFSIQPGVPNAFKLVGSENNAVGPGKRPLSSMSPTIVLKDGKPFMTVGAAGGPTIITQVLLVLSNVLDRGDDLPTAMARPRYHHQWSPDELKIEDTVPGEVLDELRGMGHTLKVVKPVGATQAIQFESGYMIGVAEPRIEQSSAMGVPLLFNPASTRPAPFEPLEPDTGGGFKPVEQERAKGQWR